MISGEYNKLTYKIFSDGIEIYTAGNVEGDSQAYTGADDGVGLVAMRCYCWSTAREMAAERSEELGTIRRISDEV